MKLYDCTTAPSPRRVRLYLAEKGVSVPTVQVDLRNGEQFSPAFRAINPECTVPVLELDNGTRIADILAICRYFEEHYPEPRLMGRTAEQKAVMRRGSAGLSGMAFTPPWRRFAILRRGSKDAPCPDRSHTSRSRR